MHIVNFARIRPHQTFAFSSFIRVNLPIVLQAACFCRALLALPSIWAVLKVIVLFWDGSFELPVWAGISVTHVWLPLAQLSPVSVQDGTLPSRPAGLPALLLLISAVCFSSFCSHATSVSGGSQILAYLKVYLEINHHHVIFWVFLSQKLTDGKTLATRQTTQTQCLRSSSLQSRA